MNDVMQRLYAQMTEKELRVQVRNDNAIARAGSLQAAYGNNPSRVVPGRGEWAGTFWCLKGDISDGPFAVYIDAINHGRELDGLPLLAGFPRNTPRPQPKKESPVTVLKTPDAASFLGRGAALGRFTKNTLVRSLCAVGIHRLEPVAERSCDRGGVDRCAHCGTERIWSNSYM